MLCDLVDVLVVANVDGPVHEQQIDQVTVILLYDFLEQSMDIRVGSFLQQVLGYGDVVLRTNFDVAERIISELLMNVRTSAF